MKRWMIEGQVYNAETKEAARLIWLNKKGWDGLGFWPSGGMAGIVEAPPAEVPAEAPAEAEEPQEQPAAAPEPAAEPTEPAPVPEPPVAPVQKKKK